ncbi:HAD-IIA family hydrolase [Halalkalibacterium halodurans]|uniref:Acid sugar phosphatase n=1 Tax=Halalkalibacterium halodurans TaxID=86665 RepID=A0A0M0KLY9_ALKHA|nr:HAD-IIA family hydrolase [Halalkalibacterium halodurans]MED4164778.1 HAD-IIA family hydrolase [Halalkalibacterium halodurans]
MKEYRTYFFDLDGTLVNGKTLFPYAKEIIAELTAQKKQLYFLTNHPIRSRKELKQHLQQMGLTVSMQQLLTPTLAILEYFGEKQGPVSLYIVGSPMIKEEISREGLHLLHSSRDPVCGEVYVILGMAPNIGYNQLQEAFFLLQQGARLVLLNPDLFCPTPNGLLLDTGSIARVLMNEKMDIHQAETVGKPSIWMQQVLLKKIRHARSRSVMIGDSLTSDIAIGQAVGIDTVLLYSGVTKKSSLEFVKQKPTYEYDSLKQLYEALKEVRYV